MSAFVRDLAIQLKFSNDITYEYARRFAMLVTDLCKILRSAEEVDVLGGYCI